VNEVIRVLLGAFIVAHGLLTAFIWVSPAKADAPFRATHSWLVGDSRPVAVGLALAAAAGFTLAGIGFVAQQAWWATTGVGAGVVALLLVLSVRRAVFLQCLGRVARAPPPGAIHSVWERGRQLRWRHPNKVPARDRATLAVSRHGS
jgi:hypothetical protein